MNSEASRLETFDNWPTAAAVSPGKIARAGFFYTKHNLTVECFSCHVQITEWNYDDQVMAKHRLLSPQCLFVENPLASGNIPKLAETTATPIEPATPQEDYKDEAVRLSTYTCWPKTHIVTPEALAKSGFYSLKYKDFTKCAFCDVVLVSWEAGDDPDKEHQRCSADCSFVQSIINQRTGEENKLTQLSNLQVVSSDNFQDLGVQEHKAPKNPKYVTYESRLETFLSWPSTVPQKPEDLACAGFYYEGVGDRVRCFHCDGGLNHWDPQDEPWSQHAQWFPKCAYVHIIKGSDFVNSLPNDQMQELATTTPPKPQCKRRVTDSEVEEYLSSEPALAALNIGLHVGRVKQAITDRLEETGIPFSSSDALIEATLNLQMEEEDEDGAMNVDNPRLSEGVSKVLSTALQRALTEQNRTDNCDNAPKESLQNSVQSEEGKGNETLVNISLEEENRMLKEARMCKICMDAEVGIVFLPCGHLTTCITCATNLQY
ncbi:Inhibitor of Apoptosis domain [Popillia japonica]|uniref:Inhibitor of Apoptosis domain n=1 Tax=Popillia japonica TaxID=7064 RepID=A0AAW1NAW3_POPJA